MSKLLGNLPQGLLFVISAPAGTGKTTLSHMLCEEFSCVTQSTSCTTRPMRLGEIEEKHYHFLTQQAFDQMIAKGELLEYATVFGHLYGTSKAEVEQQQRACKHVLLVIDTQ